MEESKTSISRNHRRGKPELKNLTNQIVRKISDELKHEKAVRPSTLKEGLALAFEAEEKGLRVCKNEIITKLKLSDFLNDLEERKRATAQGNRFRAYFGNSPGSILQTEPGCETMQKYLSKLVFKGLRREILHKKVQRKVKRMFKPEAGAELLKEVITLVDRHPYVNPNVTFGNEIMRIAALEWEKHLLSHDSQLLYEVTFAMDRAKAKIIKLAISALKGYAIDEYEINKVRHELWRGKLFEKGLRSLPGSTLMIAFFNDFCVGFREFLTITNTPGSLSTAEKLRKKGATDDANYLRAVALYLRHGESGKAVGLHAEVYSQRPIFTSFGVIDKASLATTISKMISTFQKWERRVAANHPM